MLCISRRMAMLRGGRRWFSSTFNLKKISGKSNICLMGPPGSGKTSVAALLANKLSMKQLDVDNDHLESVWGTTVAKKLKECGDEKFLDAESDATLAIDASDSIISLTGSNPMRKEGMQHLRKDGVCVFLDVDPQEIVKRCEAMKVDRIVGQSTKSLPEILAERRSVYEENYDVRVLVEAGASVEQIAAQVETELKKDQTFFSTRDVGRERPSHFADVIRTGLAPDRGLYFPEHIPSWTLGQLDRLVNLSYQERALRLLERFPIGTLAPTELRKMIHAAYSSFDDPNNVAPLRKIEDKTFIMEQFHGPTASFKDLALQLTPRLFQHSIATSGQEKEDFLFIVATSGDTGSACLDGFGKMNNTPVVVLYPEGGVSPIQEAQMTSATGDVCVISVAKDFDFCQTVVKDIFGDREVHQQFKELGVRLASGNSINWGRLFPQIPYTFNAYLDLVRDGVISMGDEMDFCVPSGNFGNILGSVLARRMGLPVGRLIAASNVNNIMSDFLMTGAFDVRGRKLLKTTSPSIDILLPSNLERLVYLLTHDAGQIVDLFSQHTETGRFVLPDADTRQLQTEMEGGWASEEAAANAIRQVYGKSGAVLDPHTAVGKAVVDDLVINSNNPMVIASTAHFSKFPKAVLEALAIETPDTAADLLAAVTKIESTIKPHKHMADVATLPTLHHTRCPADVDVILDVIRNFLRERKGKR